MHPHQIISVDQEQTVKDEKETIVIRKISVSVWGMGLELSPITINYLAVLKTFCVHVLCNLYNLSSLTEMKLFQWRHAVFVLNCWLQPSPRAAPIISWSFASELKVNGDRSSPWNSLDFFWTEKLKMRFLAARKPKSHCKC